jgi:hypothetical protein
VAPVLLVAVLAACTEQDAPSSDVGTADTGGGGELSPLEHFLGKGAVSFEGGLALSSDGSALDSPVGLSEDDLSRRREEEQLIADCMRAEGFEYVPYVVDPSDSDHPFEDAYALPPDEFAAAYGYGISTTWADIERPEDPNEAIRDAMSPAELEAYWVAMHGERADGYEEFPGKSPPPLAQSGCAGKVAEQVYGNLDEYGRDPQWEALASDLSALDIRIDDDPRVIQAEDAWIACMAEAGYPGIDHIGGGQILLANRIDDVLEIEGSEALKPWNEADPEALRELQHFEIAIASADQACRVEHFDEVFREVRTELEAEFVEEHRDELERHRERLAEGG